MLVVQACQQLPSVQILTKVIAELFLSWKRLQFQTLEKSDQHQHLQLGPVRVLTVFSLTKTACRIFWIFELFAFKTINVTSRPAKDAENSGCSGANKCKITFSAASRPPSIEHITSPHAAKNPRTVSPPDWIICVSLLFNVLSITNGYKARM